MNSMAARRLQLENALNSFIPQRVGTGPTIPNGALMPLLQDMFPRLGGARRRIAGAVLNDPEYFVSHSVSELARHCGVGTASLVYFCRFLGLKGISAFKIAIARELGKPSLIPEHSFHSKDRVPSILDSVFESHLKTLRQTLALNSTGSFESAVSNLHKARRILVFSPGLTCPISHFLYGCLRLISLPAHIEFDAELQLACSASLKGSEVVIAISAPAAAPHLLECLQLAKERGATTI